MWENSPVTKQTVNRMPRDWRRARRRGARRAAGCGRRAGGAAGRGRWCRRASRPVSRSRPPQATATGRSPVVGGRGGRTSVPRWRWGWRRRSSRPAAAARPAMASAPTTAQREPGAVARGPARGGPGGGASRRPRRRGRSGGSTSADDGAVGGRGARGTGAGAGRGRRRCRCCRRTAGPCASGPAPAGDRRPTAAGRRRPGLRARAHGGRRRVDAEGHDPPAGQAEHEPARAAADVEDGRVHGGQDGLLLGGGLGVPAAGIEGKGGAVVGPQDDASRPSSHQGPPARRGERKRRRCRARPAVRMGDRRRRRRRGRRPCRCPASARPGRHRSPSARRRDSWARPVVAALIGMPAKTAGGRAVRQPMTHQPPSKAWPRTAGRAAVVGRVGCQEPVQLGGRDLGGVHPDLDAGAAGVGPGVGQPLVEGRRRAGG